MFSTFSYIFLTHYSDMFSTSSYIFLTHYIDMFSTSSYIYGGRLSHTQTQTVKKTHFLKSFKKKVTGNKALCFFESLKMTSP